jgi:hypothetical protein
MRVSMQRLLVAILVVSSACGSPSESVAPRRRAAGNDGVPADARAGAPDNDAALAADGSGRGGDPGAGATADSRPAAATPIDAVLDTPAGATTEAGRDDGADQAPDQADAGSDGDAGSGTDAVPCCPTQFIFRALGSQVELMGYPAPLDWQRGTPMRLEADAWQVEVCLPFLVPLYFKYRIDGTTWRHDPTHPDVVDDGFGGVNTRLLPICACPAAGRRVGQS